MGEEVEVRIAGPSDRDALLAMYNDFEPLGAALGLPPVHEAGRSAWIDRLLGEAVNWVAVDAAGRLVGHTILAESGSGEAEVAFFVHQTYRCRRIGTRLVSAALDAARELGHHRVWATVYTDNVPALRLLRGRGFSQSRLVFPTMELELLLEQRETAVSGAGATRA